MNLPFKVQATDWLRGPDDSWSWALGLPAQLREVDISPTGNLRVVYDHIRGDGSTTLVIDQDGLVVGVGVACLVSSTEHGLFEPITDRLVS